MEEIEPKINEGTSKCCEQRVEKKSARNEEIESAQNKSRKKNKKVKTTVLCDMENKNIAPCALTVKINQISMNLCE